MSYSIYFWCHFINFWCHDLNWCQLINIWCHFINFWCHVLNWCHFINFWGQVLNWCQLINIWGHVLLITSSGGGWSKGLGRKKKMLKPARQPAVGGRATGGKGCCITSPHTVAHNRHPCHSCVCTFYTDIVGLPLCDVCTCDCVLLLLTKH